MLQPTQDLSLSRQQLEGHSQNISLLFMLTRGIFGFPSHSVCSVSKRKWVLLRLRFVSNYGGDENLQLGPKDLQLHLTG
jgi:hypothetical protein